MTTLGHLKRTVLENDLALSSAEQQSKCRLDTIPLSFDEYLVNTYEDDAQAIITQDTQVNMSQPLSIQEKQVELQDPIMSLHQSRSLNRILLDNNELCGIGADENDEEVSETNLLDETSMFKHNLPSQHCSFEDHGRTEETQVAAKRSLHCYERTPVTGDDNGYKHLLNSSSDISKTLTPSPIIISKGGGLHHGCDFRISSDSKQPEMMIQSQSIDGFAGGVTTVGSNSVLRQGSQIGQGVYSLALKNNKSSLFKASAPTYDDVNESRQSHFITFKPQQQQSQSSPSPSSATRNPFPRKFKQQGQESPDKKQPKNFPLEIVQDRLKYDDVQNNESLNQEKVDEDYWYSKGWRNAHPMASPQVFSQHSGISSSQQNALSPEQNLIGGGQLTLSQLCYQPPQHVTSVTDHEMAPQTTLNIRMPLTGSGALMLQQQHQVQSLTEMPSRIQEESQELSYSNQNLVQQTLKNHDITPPGSHVENAQYSSESLVNTQESLRKDANSQNRSMTSTTSKKQMDACRAAQIDEGVVNRDPALSDKAESPAVSDQAKLQRAYISDGHHRDHQYGEHQNGGSPQVPYAMHKRTFEEIQQMALSQGDSEHQVFPKSFDFHPQHPHQLQALIAQQQQSFDPFDQQILYSNQMTKYQEHFSQNDMVLMTSISSQQQQQQQQRRQQSCSGTPSEQSQQHSAEESSSSLKNHYEAQMRRMKQTRLTKQGPSNKTPTLQQNRTKNKSLQQRQARQSVKSPDAFYKKNVEWRRQIDEVTQSKKNILSRHKLMQEAKQCTFRPALAETAKFNEKLGVGKPATADQPVGNIQTEPVIMQPVEDRCIQWADHAKKKKLQVEKRLERSTECTFEPTLISKEFSKRVCPNYDLKHKDRQVEEELAAEYAYFSQQRSDIQLNEESKNRLSQLYKSAAGAPPLPPVHATKGGMTDLQKMFIINDFLERSEAWLQKVEQKKAKIAQILDQDRNQENTFHPQVAPKTEKIHSQKMKLLQRGAQADPNLDELCFMPLQMKDREAVTREKLFEYYLPMRNRSQGRKKASETAARGEGNADLQGYINGDTGVQGVEENRPLQEAKPVKRCKSKDAKENKHPKGEIDFAGESRRFSRLIELLSQKLKEHPELQAEFLNRQMSAVQQPVILAPIAAQNNVGQKVAEVKDEDKIPSLQPLLKEDSEEHLLSLGQLQCTENVSFQILEALAGSQEIDNAAVNGEYCDSLTQIQLKGDSQCDSNVFYPSQSAGKESEETSRFQNFNHNHNVSGGGTSQQLQARIEPLDLSWLLINERQDRNMSVTDHQPQVTSIHELSGATPTDDLTDQTTLLLKDEVIQHRTSWNQSQETQKTLWEQKGHHQSSMICAVDLPFSNANDTFFQPEVKSHAQSQQNFLSDTASTNMIIAAKEPSSSMRKHLDYIFKRRLQTSRPPVPQLEQTSNEEITVADDAKTIDDRRVIPSLSCGFSKASEEVGVTKTDRSGCMKTKDRGAGGIEISVNKDTRAVMTGGGARSCTSALSRTTSPIQQEHILPFGFSAAESIRDGTTDRASRRGSREGTTDRASRRGSSSNTSRLFRRKRDKTPQSDSSTSQLSNNTPTTGKVSRLSGQNTSRLFRKRDKSRSEESTGTRVTHRGVLMNNQDITNVILQEHCPPGETFAKAEEQSQGQSTDRSVKADPQIVKLSEKLKGLKQREHQSIDAPYQNLN